ncbi:MAG: Hpt domain-containing protein, partial [Candidatus Latescibacteria bacterium]|nr:Hpt domain-containing protein [Candidatus Latescibacterota bacterium]
MQLSALDGAATTRTELPRSVVASIDREAFSYFAEEADEHLSEAETTLLSLEKSPDDRELLDRLFRNFHTLKGAAGYANLPDVVHLAHAVENLFDEIRSGQREIDHSALDIAFAAIDHLRALIDRAQMLVEGTDAPMPEIGDFLDRVAELTTSAKIAPPTQDASNAAADEETADPAEEAGEMARAAEGRAASAAIAEELATEQAPATAEEMETEEQGAATDAAELIAENGETNDIPEEFASIVHAQESLNIDDLSTLGTLNGLLEDKRDDLAATNPQLSRLTAAMALVLENIILEECDDVGAAADAVAHGVAMLCRGYYAFAVSGEEDLDDPALMQQLVAISGLPDDGLTPTADLGPEALIAIDGAGGDEPLAELADEHEAEEVGEVVALVPVEVDSEIFFDFSSEAEEHLDAAESTLLSLEGHPEDDELLNTIFRAFHTIKGASGFLNLVDVTRVSHTVEDVLDSARKKQLTLTPPIMDVILESVDLLKTLLQNVEEQIGSGSVQPRDVSAFLNKVAVATGKKEAPAALEKAAPA